MSDDSSKDGGTAGADSHPENLTDPEFSDTNMQQQQQLMTSSPPQSGDELHRGEHRKEKVKEGRKKERKRKNKTFTTRGKDIVRSSS